jgi:hypothetical protein
MKNIYLIPLYLIARLIKAPLFWVAISPFKRWKEKTDYIHRDAKVIAFISLALILWYFFGLVTSFIVTFVLLLINVLLIVSHGMKIKNER